MAALKTSCPKYQRRRPELTPCYRIINQHLDSFVKDGKVVQNPMMDELFLDNEAITLASTCSIAGKIAFGENAGKYVTKIGSGFGYFEEIPLAKGKRCYSVNGFSLHCNTAINTHARDRLEKLIE
jgi:hypothetical protein